MSIDDLDAFQGCANAAQPNKSRSTKATRKLDATWTCGVCHFDTQRYYPELERFSAERLTRCGLTLRDQLGTQEQLRSPEHVQHGPSTDPGDYHGLQDVRTDGSARTEHGLARIFTDRGSIDRTNLCGSNTDHLITRLISLYREARIGDQFLSPQFFQLLWETDLNYVSRFC
jgi:hypothetical protein